MTSRSAPTSPSGDLAWMRQAACRDQPPGWFTDPAGPDDTRKALATCRRCPVTRACLQTALARPAEADIGVWGGTTDDERHRIRSGDTARAHPVGEALQPRTRTPPDTRNGPADTAVPHSGGRENGAPPRQRLHAPEITLGRDTNGDFTDDTGRVIAFRIHGVPPYMLMIDGHCIARTSTLTEARQRAWTVLNAPTAAQAVADPARSTRRRPMRTTRP